MASKSKKKIFDESEIPTWPEYFRSYETEILPCNLRNLGNRRRGYSKMYSNKVSLYFGNAMDIKIDGIVNLISKSFMGIDITQEIDTDDENYEEYETDEYYDTYKEEITKAFALFGEKQTNKDAKEYKNKYETSKRDDTLLYSETADVNAFIMSCGEDFKTRLPIDYNLVKQDLMKESAKSDGCKLARAVKTKGHDIPATCIIHAIVPIECNKLMLIEAYESVLQIAVKNHLRSLVFPCPSINAYGYSYKRACYIALKTIREFLNTHNKYIDHIIFCVICSYEMDIYRNYMQYFFPVKKDKV